MGQKVHPRAFRLGNTATWDGKWFARGKKFTTFLRQDVEIRKFLRERFRDASLARVEIERSPSAITIILYTGKPGLIIGRGGSGVEELRKTLEKNFFPHRTNVKMNVSIKEVERPLATAQIVVMGIVLDIEKRIPFRRTMRRALEQIMKAGAKGAKVTLGGRLDGAEIARTETLIRGTIPLHTLRSNIDFGRAAAKTTYGTVGVKVWVNHGEVFSKIEDVVTSAPSPRRTHAGVRR